MNLNSINLPIDSRKTLVHVLASAERGGCERACDHVCLYSSGVQHRVIVLNGPGGMSPVWEQSGATVEHLGVMGRSRFTIAKALRERLNILRPDGLIAWHGMAELPVILNSVPESCCNVLVYGGNPASSLRAVTDWRYLWMERLLFPLKCSPLFTCCSQYVADTFEGSRYLRRFRRRAVTNGVYLLPEDVIHVPRELPTEGGGVIIGMLARLDAIKDHESLIRAFVEVRKAFPGASLELAGNGDQEARLRRLAEQLGLSDAVKFLGMVVDVTNVIRRWDIFVYATTVDEGFGIALAEGLTSGLPAVVTDIGPVREVGSHGDRDAVVYVPPHEPEALAKAVVQLIPDLRARQALSQTARSHALANLSAQKFAQTYMSLLFGVQGVSEQSNSL